MNEQLKERLTSFYQAIGYPEAAEDPLSEYILGETVQTLLNLTNQKELPQGLFYVAVYWTAGKYLSAKKNSGQLDPEKLDLTAAVSSISEGDTTVSFGTGSSTLTPEQRFDTFTQWLTGPRMGEIYRYRKLVW